MAEQALSAINQTLDTWFLSYTKKLFAYYGEGTYGHSAETNAWQISIPDNNLKVSIGWSAEQGDYVYIVIKDGSRKDGRVQSLKDLKLLFPDVFGGS